MNKLLVNSQGKALLTNGMALMVGVADRPYDSRVTYLESDGVGYFDTGVNLRSLCTAVMGLEFKAVPSSTFIPYGIWWDSSSGPRNQMSYISGGSWRDTNTSYTQTSGVSGSVQVDHPYGIIATSKRTYADDNTNFFLCRNNNGNGNSMTGNVRATFLRMAQGGVFVKDTYPVRKNGVGYLYDVVSGLLLPVQNSGVFTYGADTNFTLSYLNSQMPGTRQGMAIYDGYLARANNGTALRISAISATGDLTTVADSTIENSHNNSMQFAPTLEAGQTLPYLYSAELAPNLCYVYDFNSSYQATRVQTITLGVTGIAGGCNLQIGDDGHIWGACSNDQTHYTFMKFRKVLVSEGDITLTDADILDSWTTSETFPYSTYVWQGMKVKRGKIWFLHGATGAGQHRGIVIYDCSTHAHLGAWDLSYYNFEYEDLDFWGAGNDIILGTIEAATFRITYDTI